jgi:hypothetical protein
MRRVLPAICVLLTAVSLHAANLVVNPHFDQGIGGWSPSTTATTTWEKADALASPSSGALALTATLLSGTRSAQQCVSVTPGAIYEAGVKAMIDGQQPAAEASLMGLFYESANCGGPFLTQSMLETAHVTAQSNGRFTPVAARIQAPASAHSILLATVLGVHQPGGTVHAHFDDVYFALSGTGCVADMETLCLTSGRYRVTATFRAPQGRNAEPAHVVQLTKDSGYMWFFNDDNVEVTVKVLDVCASTGWAWVFAAGMTNVEVHLRVLDTETHAIQEYTNPSGQPFQVILDTSAFGCA